MIQLHFTHFTSSLHTLSLYPSQWSIAFCSQNIHNIFNVKPWLWISKSYFKPKINFKTLFNGRLSMNFIYEGWLIFFLKWKQLTPGGVVSLSILCFGQLNLWWVNVLSKMLVEAKLSFGNCVGIFYECRRWQRYMRVDFMVWCFIIYWFNVLWYMTFNINLN